MNVDYRSPSPEPTQSDIRYALSDILFSTNDCVDNRPFSPESVHSDIQERPISVESVPDYKPLSPEAMGFLQNIQSISSESTQLVDEFKGLSIDSSFPWFKQNFVETTTDTHNGYLSPESLLSDLQCGLATCNMEAIDMRPLSPQSERSNEECNPLSPISSIPNIKKKNKDSSYLSQTLDKQSTAVKHILLRHTQKSLIMIWWFNQYLI